MEVCSRESCDNGKFGISAVFTIVMVKILWYYRGYSKNDSNSMEM